MKEFIISNYVLILSIIKILIITIIGYFVDKNRTINKNEKQRLVITENNNQVSNNLSNMNNQGYNTMNNQNLNNLNSYNSMINQNLNNLNSYNNINCQNNMNVNNINGQNKIG